MPLLRGRSSGTHGRFRSCIDLFSLYLSILYFFGPCDHCGILLYDRFIILDGLDTSL